MKQLFSRGLGLLLAALVAFAPISHAAQQTINRGATAGDGTGETLFSAFGKVNANDAELFGAKTEFVANFAALPAVGEAGKIYVASDTQTLYRWTGTAYDDLSSMQFVANAAALPAVGEALKAYVALDTGQLYRWAGAAYVGLGGLTFDTSGNIVANIVPRTGELATLLTISGGAGEVSTATNVRALVLHNGVANGAVAFYPSAVRSLNTFAKPFQQIAVGTTFIEVVLTQQAATNPSFNALTTSTSTTTGRFFGFSPNKGYEATFRFTHTLPTISRWRLQLQQNPSGDLVTWVAASTGDQFVQGAGTTIESTVTFRVAQIVTGATERMRLVIEHNDAANQNITSPSSLIVRGMD